MAVIGPIIQMAKDCFVEFTETGLAPVSSRSRRADTARPVTGMYHALTIVHCRRENLSLPEFLRTCYYWRFSKDITQEALQNDTAEFHKNDATPIYAADYLINIYGAQ